MSPQNTGAAELSLLVSKGQARPSSLAQFGDPSNSNTNRQYRATKRASDEDESRGYLTLPGRSFGRKESLNTQDNGKEQPASLLSTAENHGLDGLIMRREESRFDPEQYAEEHMDATQASQSTLATQEKEQSDSDSTPHIRRKMTVRIEMEQFETINTIATKTGRTYQDIQAAAIAHYLDSDIAEIEHGYESFLGSQT